MKSDERSNSSLPCNTMGQRRHGVPVFETSCKVGNGGKAVALGGLGGGGTEHGWMRQKISLPFFPCQPPLDETLAVCTVATYHFSHFHNAFPDRNVLWLGLWLGLWLEDNSDKSIYSR